MEVIVIERKIQKRLNSMYVKTKKKSQAHRYRIFLISFIKKIINIKNKQQQKS